MVIFMRWSKYIENAKFCAESNGDGDFYHFSFGKEKLVAPLIAIPNVDKANRRQEKGNKLN